MPETLAALDSAEVAKFAGRLAHDLNNLLQVVNGNLELLASKIDDDRLRYYVENAQTAAEELTALAHRLSENSALD